MIELKRSKKVTEEIKLGDEVLTLTVDVQHIANTFRVCQLKIQNAYDHVNALRSAGTSAGAEFDAALTEFGEAIISMLELIFGKESADKILAFYKNKFIELAEQVLPPIVGKIMPLIRETMKEQAARIRHQSKKSRWRR